MSPIGQRLIDREVVEVESLEVFVPSAVCDVCQAARLVEAGVMPSSLEPDYIHQGCRTPGDCACGCEYSEGARCVNCGRLRPMRDLEQADGEHASCVDRAACGASMLSDGPAAPEPAKAKSGPKAARPRAASAPRAPRPKAEKVTPPCKCECGELTGGGMYRPGHDSRHVKRLVEEVRHGSKSAVIAQGELPSDALRGKLDKQLAGW